MRSNKLTFFLNIGLFNKNLTNKLDKKLLKIKQERPLLYLHEHLSDINTADVKL